MHNPPAARDRYGVVVGVTIWDLGAGLVNAPGVSKAFQT